MWQSSVSNHIQRIEENTFRICGGISSDQISEINGTAFAVSENLLITAHHVVDAAIDNRLPVKIQIMDSKGEQYEGHIARRNEAADLALIKLDSPIDISEPFYEVENAPIPGTRCIWGGYPKLIGERTARRIRFARGIVSSSVFSIRSGKGCFFEVDGNFSPGQSGSPVIDTKTGELTGVVSRSAGSLVERFSRAGHLLRAIQVIQSTWQIFKESTETMEKIHNSMRDALPEIDKRLRTLCKLFQFHNRPHWGKLPIPNNLWIRSDWTYHTTKNLPDQVIGILEGKGIRIAVRPEETDNDEKKKLTLLRAESDVAWSALIDLLLDWTELMTSVVDDSFQMGIGIATCGKPLKKMLS